MSIINGDKVAVHYIGTFDDGTEFDRSSENSPLEFTVGSGQVIDGFDKAVLGKTKGETFKVTIPANEAYGESDEALIFQVPRAELPEEVPAEIGLNLHVETEQGHLEVVIVAVDDESITLDANHPMAGENLTFEITIA